MAGLQAVSQVLATRGGQTFGHSGGERTFPKEDGVLGEIDGKSDFQSDRARLSPTSFREVEQQRSQATWRNVHLLDNARGNLLFVNLATPRVRRVKFRGSNVFISLLHNDGGENKMNKIDASDIRPSIIY